MSERISAIAWFKKNALLGTLMLLCVVLAFATGTFALKSSNQADRIASLEAQLASAGKQLSASTDFKDITKSFLPPVTDTDRIDGQSTAKVILVEYSDLECPFCKDLHGSINQLKKEYGSTFAHVFRHLPIASLHANAPMEAEAAECVANQAGNAGFFTYIDAVFKGSKSTGTTYSEADMQALAGTLGFNAAEVKSCMDSNATLAAVDASIKEGKDLGIRGTPTWFLIRTSDGKTKQAEGAKPLQTIRDAIDSLLKES